MKSNINNIREKISLACKNVNREEDFEGGRHQRRIDMLEEV